MIHKNITYANKGLFFRAFNSFAENFGLKYFYCEEALTIASTSGLMLA
jgi:hypothetical protein